MTTLIGANLEQFWGSDPVEPGPVEAIVTVMNFAGQSRHEGNAVVFTFGK